MGSLDAIIDRISLQSQVFDDVVVVKSPRQQLRAILFCHGQVSTKQHEANHRNRHCIANLKVTHINPNKMRSQQNDQDDHISVNQKVGWLNDTHQTLAQVV